MDRDTIFDSFSAVQNKVKLKEGINGIVKFFAVLDRFPDSPMQKLSQKASFPIPLCVAIRNEFEKLGWCKRTNKGTVLTSQGQEIISSISKTNVDFSCKNCTKSGLHFPLDGYSTQLDIIKKYSDLRGQPNTVIDQSFATPQTSLLRVLTMSHNYDLFYSTYALVGDSDLTSIALALFLPSSSRIVVFDIDPKLKEIIDLANSELDLSIEFIELDLRKTLPEEYSSLFDCFITDPPYTQTGVQLFVSRGIQLLKKKTNGIFYLSFGSKPPEQMLAIQKDLTDMGGLLTNILHGFNEYIGAQKLGGISNLYRLSVGASATPLIQDNFEGPLYTGDVNPILRTYLCKNCKTEYIVGKNKEFVTIEQLKNQGCTQCSNFKFLKKQENKME
ncbi:MAG: bis-aminopropyl spermidine synthase family protein [Candidatus Heimdallarchaeota archaeon]|nr:bis-aminopropyl spermidine synthase family protein [Candidatus Heimdallarchaeota archaeon]